MRRGEPYLLQQYLCDFREWLLYWWRYPDKVRDIYLNNVHLNLKKMTTYDGGVYDKRPCRGEGFIYNKVYGVYVEQAKNVEIEGLEVKVEPKVNFGGKTLDVMIEGNLRQHCRQAI